MIKVGLVGCGAWGKNYLRNFDELEDSELTAVCDADPKKIEALRSKHPALKLYLNYNEICRDPEIEALVIATPAATHYPIAREALKSNKHLLIEKPLVLKSEEGEELIRLAREKNRILMAGYLMLYHPAILRLKEMIGRKELGEIRYFHSQRTSSGSSDPKVDVFWDLASHDLSVILHLLGREPESVSTKRRSFARPVAEFGFITLQFTQNAMAYLYVSWLDSEKTRKLSVVGSKKTAIFDDLASPSLKIFEPGNVSMPELKASEPLKAQCRHFLDCIKSGKSPKTSGEEALKIVKILENLSP